MTEAGDDWRDYRDHVRQIKRRRRDRETDAIAVVATHYHVERFTMYHYRVAGRLDLYPTNRAWHDIATRERGNYTDALELCRERLGGAR